MHRDENNPVPFEPIEPSEPARPVPLSAPSDAPPPSQLEGPALAQQPLPPASQLPEDLRAPWDWMDLLVFVLVALFGTFLVSMVMVLVFAGFGVSLSQLRNSATEKSFFAIVNQALLSLGLLVYLAVQIRLRVRAPFWRTIGWRRLETQIPRGLAYLSFIIGGFLLSMFVQFSSGIVRPRGKLPIEAFFQDRRSALLLMLLSVLLAPVFEETVFRGYIYPVIARSFGVTASVVATGTLFGLLHAPQLWGGWEQIGLLVLVGIVFTYARAVTRTVVSSYILHVSYNSFLLVTFLVGSHWLRVLPPVR
ncbi:MAG TPA: type II CAAX endopeptidase family protein [Candidatus Acidoferrales bacterium]|nr:type II CAAX endopeptidase family protein [Candidatus Acidoferrales bacterium]